MADDKYYRITKDEALFNAYNAYANTNNPDDRAKIENLYDSFKKGKISTSEFNVAVMQAAKAQGKANVAKQGGTPTTEDKLALQKRGEQTNAGAAKYSESISIGLAWANATLPRGTYNDLAKQVYATLKSRDPNRYEKAARALSEMMDESARQQKAFHDATEGSKVVLGGDPKKAAEYVRQLRAANAAKAQAEAEKKAKAEAIAKANADAKAAGGTQGVQGAQAGVKTGNAVVGGGVQGSNNKPRMSDAEINAFLNEELGGDTTGNGTYASAGIPRGGVVSPATMMRTSGVPPVQVAYGNNAPMGEEFDYTLTYDPMSNSMKPNDPYSYYDPSRNAPSEGDLLTYDPMTSQLVRR